MKPKLTSDDARALLLVQTLADLRASGEAVKRTHYFTRMGDAVEALRPAALHWWMNESRAELKRWHTEFKVVRTTRGWRASRFIRARGVCAATPAREGMTDDEAEAFRQMVRV